MAIQYERYENDFGVDEDNISSASEDSLSVQHARSSGPPQGVDIPGVKWPLRIGALQIITGFITVILGGVQLVILPVLYGTSTSHTPIIQLSEENCYGIGLWAGILLILTGSFGVRGALLKSRSVVYLFFWSVSLNLILFSGIFLFILIGYSQEAFADNAWLLYIHIVITLCVACGVVLLVVAFTQYYEDIFCGELQLCRKCIHCCCPCCCPRAVYQEELMAEGSGRPPSLPV